MTQPDQAIPPGALGATGLAAFASTTEGQWRDQMVAPMVGALAPLLGVCEAILSNPLVSELRALVAENSSWAVELLNGVQALYESLSAISGHDALLDTVEWLRSTTDRIFTLITGDSVVGKTLVELVDAFAGGLSAIIEFFTGSPGSSLADLVAWFDGILDWMVGLVGDAVSINLTGWTTAIANLLAMWTDAFGDFNVWQVTTWFDVAEKLWNGLLGWVSAEIAINLENWRDNIANVLSWWTGLFGDSNIFSAEFAPLELISDLFDKIVGVVGSALGIVLTGWQTAVANLLAWWTDLWGDLNIFAANFNPLELISDLFDKIVEIVGAVLGIDLTGWSTAVANLMAWWTNLWGDLNIFAADFNPLHLISDLFDRIVEIVGAVLGIDLTGWSTAISNLLAWWTGLFGDMNVFSADFSVVAMLTGLSQAMLEFLIDDVTAWIKRVLIQPIIAIFTRDGTKVEIADLGAAVGNFLTRTSTVLVSQLQGRIPHALLGIIPVSNINDTSENLLDPQGGFDLSSSVAENDGWEWDSAVGYGPHTGSVKLTTDGALHQLFTRVSVPVVERDILTVSAFVKTTNYVGSGTPIRLCVIPFSEDVQGTTEIIGQSGAAADWTPLTDSWTVPADVTSVTIMLEVLATATSGVVHWDTVSVVKTGKMRQSLIDRLEDMWDHTTEIIDAGRDDNPFDAGTPLFNLWQAFRIQHDSVIGANATIEQLRNRITVLESPSKNVAVDDFERSGDLTPVWNVTESGSGDGGVQLDGHHAYWSPAVGFAGDNYALCRFVGGGNYGSQHSATAYQLVTATVDSGPFRLSVSAPALDLLAMVADDNSSLVRARWDGNGNLTLSYLQAGGYTTLATASVAVPSGGTTLGLKVGILEDGTPDWIVVYQNSSIKILHQDTGYASHNYRNNRGWGFGLQARGTPLLGQYLPGSLHQWTGNDQ